MPGNCCAAAVKNGAAASPSAERSGAGDTEKLRGTWVAVQAIRNGRDAAYLRGHRLTFEDNRFLSRGEKGDLLFQGTYQMNSGTDPAQIDLRHERDTLEGTIWKGIFRIEGMALRLCNNAPNPQAQRPQELEAPPGSGHIAILFKRA